MAAAVSDEVLKLTKRDLTGKKAKRLFKEGFIPVVMYNSKTQSQNLQAKLGDITRLLNHATTSTIITVEVDGEKSVKAVIKAVDLNPVTDLVRHVSFFEIDENALVDFEVPFEFVGISPAVKNNLGTLVHAASSVEIRCKPADLPEVITIDTSKLEQVGDSILVGDIELPEGVELIREEQKGLPIVSVIQLRKAEVKVEETEEAEGEGAAETATEGDSAKAGGAAAE